MEIREAWPIDEDDLKACAALDLSYETDYVWQVDLREEHGAIVLGFRTARLPRLLHVIRPYDPGVLHNLHRLPETDMTLLLAETHDALRGYLAMRFDPGHQIAWVVEMGVGHVWRRQGVGSALFQQAYRLAAQKKLRQLIVETQTKNYPGICFCQKHGLVFCGFNDRYYANHEVALFFGQSVRGA